MLPWIQGRVRNDSGNDGSNTVVIRSPRKIPGTASPKPAESSTQRPAVDRRNNGRGKKG